MKNIYTVYSESSDMTFIMEETDTSLSVVGFYFGSPNSDATAQFYGDVTAEKI